MKTTTQPRPPLTHSQTRVLDYMAKFLQVNDQLPPMANIASAFGWASPNAADSHAKALEKKGYLVRNEIGGLMFADRPGSASAYQLPPPDICTPGVPRGHGAITGYTPTLVAQIVRRLHQAHPPQLIPLTQPEKQRLWNDAMAHNRSSTTDAAMDFGTAIESAHLNQMNPS